MTPEKIQEIVDAVKKAQGADAVDPAMLKRMVSDALAAEKAAKEAADEGALDAKQIAEKVAEEVRTQLAPHTRDLDLNGRENVTGNRASDNRSVERVLSNTRGGEKVNAFQTAQGELYLARKLDKVMREKYGKTAGGMDWLEERFADTASDAGFDVRATAFSTTGAGTGDEFVFTLPSADLIDRVDQRGDIASMFPEVIIPARRESVTRPRDGAAATVYTVAQATATDSAEVTPSNPGTDQVVFTAGKHGAQTYVSAETIEDSIVPQLDWIIAQLGKAHAQELENAIINGDTTSTLDSTMAAGDSRAIFDGLREKCINDFTAATKDMSSLTAPSDVNELRALMGKYGINPQDLMYIVPPTLYYKWLKNDELTTIEKWGPNASNLKGALGMLQGSPVVVSSVFPGNLNASGVIDGVTATKHGYLVVNKAGWAVVRKRDLRIDVDPFSRMGQDQLKVVSFRRVGFRNVYADTQNLAAYAYNLAN